MLEEDWENEVERTERVEIENAQFLEAGDEMHARL